MPDSRCEHVERRALGRQQGVGPAGDQRDDVVRLHVGAVAPPHLDDDVPIELPEGLDRDLEPGDDQRRLGQECAPGPRLLCDCRRGRHVAGADVFGKRVPNQIGVGLAARRVERHQASAGFNVTATEGSPTVSRSAPARTAAFKSRSMCFSARISSSAPA